MKKNLTKYISVGLLIISLALLTADPTSAADAVNYAFEICTQVILPSLLPFFFISGIVSALGIPETLASVAHRPLSKLFGLSGYACAPMLLGFLGGYPVGAAALAELVKEEKLSSLEAEKLLPICNNTGPAFIIGAVGGGIFSSAKVGILLYIAHISSALLLALLFRERKAAAHEKPQYTNSGLGLMAALPPSIRSAVEKSMNICGFVIFFSVISTLMDELGILSFAALSMNKLFGAEIGFCRCFILGTLELGGGIASMRTLSPCPLCYSLAAFILGFGSLSVHCQTLAFASSANIKCARHFAGRIIHGALSALTVYLLSSLLRI